MLKTLVSWKPETTLVPFSGIQFLDFGFNIDEVQRASRSFIERTTGQHQGVDLRTLFPLTGDDDTDRAVLQARDPRDEEYSINKIKALEPFLDKWMPAPVLRIRPGSGPGGREILDDGPSTWARLYVTELPERDPKTGHSHRVVLAFDTDCGAHRDGQPYLMPTPKDAEDEREFRFASKPEDMDWFLRKALDDPDSGTLDVQQWVDDWLLELFKEFKEAQYPNRPLREEDFPYAFEHWARYLTLLHLLDEALSIPKIRLLDTVSSDQRYQPVDVDLVLDIGNSRNCGILIESYPDEARVDLNNSYALELRDLGRPEHSYNQPFESRVEFAQASFGKDHIARRAQRTRSFLWPSLVRVGPEAMRLAAAEEGTETTSGLSSPKRYLWDTQPINQDWRFQNASASQELPLIARSAFRFLNESGDVLRQVELEEQQKLRKPGETSRESAIRAKFSRSSLYGFMLAEIFFQALVRINEPATRANRQQSGLPRRLRKIILTLPSATPVQEQSIMRSRAEGAIRLLWDILDWTNNAPPGVLEPRVIIDWDEASCTQLVYLYSEITQKFSGQITSFFELTGRPRPFVDKGQSKPQRGAKPEPSLRIACVDIGGGTTDLMVTTYYSVENRAMRPTQNFREGFRIAGDEVVREVVSRIVLRQLEDRLKEAGGGHIREMLQDLFSDKGNASEQERQRRRQFSLRVLTPVALALLDSCETLAEGETRTLKLGDIVGWCEESYPHNEPEDDEEPIPRLAVPGGLLSYLEGPAQVHGAAGFDLAEMSFEVDAVRIAEVVSSVMRSPLLLLCEVINHLGCDVVLLAGRPSRLPAVFDMVQEMMPVTPDRIIPMHSYRVGVWYPFRDPMTNRIGDPKSTAAVGGLLCAMSDTQIPNFKLYTDRLAMVSTARYFGEMELHGQITDDKMIFRDIDLDRTPQGASTEAELRMFTQMQIGFRQLPLERWTATPLYRLEFANDSIARRPTPLHVTLGRAEVEQDPEKPEQMRRAEALKEAFRVIEVIDDEKDPCRPDDVRLRLHTLGFDDSYWLDTGTFNVG